MIITARKQIPNLWIFIAVLPWSAAMLNGLAMGTAFQFSLLKFLENPVGLTFIMSLPGLISIFLNPVVNFMSDRVWTRFGRRKPFIVTSWVGSIACIAAMPLAPNIWFLIGLFLLYNLFNDIGQPIETLKMEIVPPKQRVTSSAAGNWILNFSILMFNLVAIGRFDDYKFMAGLPVSGEQSIYWTVAAAMTVMILLIMLGIKETDPKSELRGERFSVRNFFRGILNKDLWPVYMLITGTAMMTAGLGVMGTLLYTEQWAYSKQEMGFNVAVGGIINCFLIILLGFFAQKVPRMKTYQWLMGLSLVINFCFFIYVHFFIYDRRPSLVEVIFFGEALSIVGLLTGMIYLPLVYDYIPRNEMGTYAAGSNLLNRVVSIATLNGVGIFIWAYAALFLPPGGDSTRVGLRSERSEGEVATMLARAGLRDSATGNPLTLNTQAWYATTSAISRSHAFEIRSKSDDSVDLHARRDEVTSRSNVLIAEEKNARLLAENAQRKGNAREAEKQLATAEARRAAAAPLLLEIERMDAELAARSDRLYTQIATALGGELATEGAQVTSAFEGRAWVFEYPVPGRPFTKKVEQTLDVLRLEVPAVIDLRAVKQPAGYVLVLSTEPLPGQTRESAGVELGRQLFTLGAKRLAAGWKEAPVPAASREESLAGFTLDIIEDPLDRYPSPITRWLNAMLSQFTDVAPPERRVFGLARSLRSDATPHTGVRPASAEGHEIRVVAVLASAPLPPADPLVQTRIGEFLPGSATTPALCDLYSRLAVAAPAQRITPIQPRIATGFVKMSFDYMIGYIWMLLLGMLGLGITIAFARREAKGLIRKRGAEEAEATVEDDAAGEAGELTAGETYTPGYFLPKVGMMVFGAILIAIAMPNLGPAVKLLFNGETAYAEATRIFKEKVGGETLTFTSDAGVKAALESRDRSFVFWNEYAFRTADGREITFRAAAGSQLKPVRFLYDTDGLPSVVAVRYNPDRPDEVMLPGEFSTWFMPCTLALFGLAGVIVGGLLAFYARRPIPVPVLHNVRIGETA